MEISILQWNVWYKEDIENVLKVLKQTQPDIVCLQELTIGYQKTHPDTVQYIAQNLGYESYSQSIDLNDEEWKLANAIFSRFPIQQSRTVWINEPTGVGGYADEKRAYIEASLQVDNDRLTVGTTHMSYTHQFETTERKQHETNLLLAAIEENKRKFVLTGDFNATPGSYTIDRMLQKLTSLGPTMNEPTWTTKPFSYNGFDETELSWRLDYVFGTNDLEIVENRVINTQYSDHLPLLVRVIVDESPEKPVITQ